MVVQWPVVGSKVSCLGVGVGTVICVPTDADEATRGLAAAIMGKVAGVTVGTG